MANGENVDLHAAIQALRDELKRIDLAIATLEGLKQPGVDTSSVRSRRKAGRKKMNAEQRQEVSKRMRSYWVQRREQQQPD